jgi:hypothetical protein
LNLEQAMIPRGSKTPFVKRTHPDRTKNTSILQSRDIEKSAIEYRSQVTAFPPKVKPSKKIGQRTKSAKEKQPTTLKDTYQQYLEEIEKKAHDEKM